MSAASPTSAANRPSVTDGRVRRGLRTHSRIVESLLDLINDGAEEPTAHQIATAAGVSVRTIFQHFSDLEALYADLVEAQTVRFTPIFESLVSTGDFEARLSALGAQRRELYEVITPIRRVVQRRGISSPVVTRRLATVAAALRQQVREQFSNELDSLAAAAAATATATAADGGQSSVNGGRPVNGGVSPDQAIEALDLMWSFEAWDRLRSTQNLEPAEAESLMVTLTNALFAPVAR